MLNELNANKISVNISKPDLILLNPRTEKLDIVVKLKLNDHRLDSTKSGKYLGTKVNISLTWNEHVSGISIKLS